MKKIKGRIDFLVFFFFFVQLANKNKNERHRRKDDIQISEEIMKKRNTIIV